MRLRTALLNRHTFALPRSLRNTFDVFKKPSNNNGFVEHKFKVATRDGSEGEISLLSVCTTALAVSMVALHLASDEQFSLRESTVSIDAVDRELGSKTDVEDPLLTAHRLVKFYLISAGEALNGVGNLTLASGPRHVTVGTIARTVSELAAKCIYVACPTDDHLVRTVRAGKLMEASIEDYKSGDVDGAHEIIARWSQWRVRNKDNFTKVPKQSKPTSTAMIKQAFPEKDDSAYRQLSRPAHGNAAWLSAVAIQEQKRTPFATIYAMKNIGYATRCLATATSNAGRLWSGDLNEITRRALADFDIDADWDQLTQLLQTHTRALSDLNESDYADTRQAPQPRR
ncbi:hypothetical protein [Dietzia cinnamea]|uniref:hypothetical protein n=1 Tax=Dietzia cinnamea TaxID=321318 RepID=UPI000B17194C|nr:hypothetical protein [Dietzia cinnamea]